jgi:hypothetical protein
MSSLLTNDASFDTPYISTGHLPPPDRGTVRRQCPD